MANPRALLRDPAFGSPLEVPYYVLGGGTSVPATYGTFGVLELPARSFRVFLASDGIEMDIMRRTLW